MANLIVVGGVAAGMSAASKARRMDPSMRVIALERSPFMSYGSCGMPYNLLRPDVPMERLVVIPPEEFRAKRGIDARVHVEVEAIDPVERTVLARDRRTGATETLAWDALVYATGAEAIRPPWPGIDLDGVFAMRDLVDGKAIKDFVTRHAPRRAAVIGGGYIGLEMAHVLTEMGLAVTVIERLPSILAGWESEAVEPVRKALVDGGVTLLEGVTVQGFAGADGRVATVATDGPEVAADLVVVAIGVRPATALAARSGIALGYKGAVAVDRELRTNVPGIWAAGDCAEQWHRVLQRNVWVPLGTNANKQGRIAGENAAGGHAVWEGMIGTAVFRTLGIDAARTGLGRDEAREAGIDVAVSVVDGWDAAHAMADRHPIRILLVSRKDDGRVVGAQLVGGGVAKRCDVLATAIWAGMTVRDVGNLDLAYAPPFSPVWDPILVAANVAEKDFAPDGPPCRFCE